MPFGHGLYLAIKNSRALQLALLAGAIFVAYLTNNAIVARNAREKYRSRSKVRAMEIRIEAEDEIRTIEKEASDEADQALDAGRTGARSGILSDSAIARTLGRSRTSARGGSGGTD